MGRPNPEALLDTLDVLMDLSERQATPERARAAFEPVRGRHPEARIELLYQRELYDESVHYDALIRFPGATVSLSYCPDKALPWPLRGIQRWNDRDLARVNNTVIEVTDAIRLIDFVWDEERIAERLLDACIIRAELEERPISVNTQELQQEVDSFRRSRGLFTTEQTQAWMKRMGFDIKRLESIARERVELSKLMVRVTEETLEDFFLTHQREFDEARVAVIEVLGLERAAEIAELARTDPFLSVAQEVFSRGELRGDLFRRIRRLSSDELRTIVMDRAAGDILGPFPTKQGHAIIQVLSVVPATLDEETKGRVRQRLFSKWLDERRRAATVDWYWGKDRPGQRRDQPSTRTSG